MARAGQIKRRRRAVVLVAALVVSAAGAAGIHPGPADARAAENVYMLGTDREAAGAPGHYVGAGLAAGFKFFDGDLPPDLRRTAVTISSSTDPVGIVVWAEREMRASALYKGTFGFSSSVSDTTRALIRVSDGDTVTMTYVDSAGADGSPAVVRVSAPWRAGSAQPDVRELEFSNVNPQAPTLRGAWNAIAPNATVKVYGSEVSPTAIATGTAGADGSFLVTLPPMPVPPSAVWVAAVEAGSAESVRVRVWWSAVTGRMMLPEPGSPPTFGWAKLMRANCAGSACDFGGITDYSGHWDVQPALRGDWTGPGEYDLHAYDAIPMAPSQPWPWPSSAYGMPPPRRVTVESSTTTANVGDLTLLSPNLTGYVHAGVLAVPETGLWLQDPNGVSLPGGGYTRRDGRFALYLDDGDYLIWFRTPIGCGGYREPKIEVRVRGGVATPSALDIDVGIGTEPVPSTRVPITGYADAPAAVTIAAPSGEIELDLEGATGSGYINAGCASLGPRPDLTLVAPPALLTATDITFRTANVCQTYDPAAVAAAGLTPSQLDLFHIEPDNSATTITTVRDIDHGQICGRTSSFSPFALGRRTGMSQPPTPTTTTSTPTTTTTTSPPVQPRPTAPPTSPTPTAQPVTPPRAGYWMLDAAGNVYAFGDASWFGNATVGSRIAVDLEPTATKNGYWVVDDLGRIFTFGDASYLGGVASLDPGEAATSVSSTRSGRGYWIFTSRGRVFAFGDASWFGDMSGTALNGPVLDSVPTSRGKGYYMVASDGGIFAFGDASFRGSMGNVKLNAPVQSLVPDSDGAGYWLVASDGGVFAFDASFYGSMGNIRLNKPVTGMVGYRRGYVMVAEDGGIFTFGDAPFSGSLGSNPPARPVTSVAPLT